MTNRILIISEISIVSLILILGMAAIQYVSEYPELKNRDIGLLSFCRSSYGSMMEMNNVLDSYKNAGGKSFIDE